MIKQKILFHQHKFKKKKGELERVIFLWTNVWRNGNAINTIFSQILQKIQKEGWGWGVDTK